MACHESRVSRVSVHSWLISTDKFYTKCLFQVEEFDLRSLLRDLLCGSDCKHFKENSVSCLRERSSSKFFSDIPFYIKMNFFLPVYFTFQFIMFYKEFLTLWCSVSKGKMIIDFDIGVWILFLYPVWNLLLNNSWGQPAVLWMQVASWSHQSAAEHWSN